MYGLPVQVVKVYPNPEETFWVLLLGRGYPAPTQAFRWCTGRLKIDPAEAYAIEGKFGTCGSLTEGITRWAGGAGRKPCRNDWR